MNVIQIDFWQLVGMAGSALVVLVGAGWALVSIIVKQFTERLDERFNGQDELRKQREIALDQRFSALEKSIRDEGDGWRKVERELLLLKAELPRDYTRREDHIRQEATFVIRLDALGNKIDTLLASEKKHGN